MSGRGKADEVSNWLPHKEVVKPIAITNTQILHSAVLQWQKEGSSIFLNGRKTNNLWFYVACCLLTRCVIVLITY